MRSTRTKRIRRPSPALVISLLALFIALGGTVYAAKHKGIDGKLIKVNSMPGNRLKAKSVAANRLKPGVLPSPQHPITGAEINELSLGTVPNAISAEIADRAQSALDAQTALNAVNAINATKVNGHEVGCFPGTTLFAGACWQTSAKGITATAPAAAADCAEIGGVLPEALQLAAYAEQPGVNLEPTGEWADDIVSFTGPNVYAVATVSDGTPPVIGSAVFNSGGISATKNYRCVIPLVK